MSNLTWFLLGVAMSLVAFLLLMKYYSKQRKKRIMTLTLYLESASCGRESSLARIEDEFSLLEDEIYKTVAELRIAREKAQQERCQQADNLADIAHQLKTPLTSMSLMTQLLVADASKEQQEYIGCIDNQLSRLDWLTSSLLTMSRLDANSVEFVPVKLTFEELATEALEPLEQLLSGREQEFCVYGKEVPLVCDRRWTSEALINLIKNCSEHTPHGGQIVATALATPLYLQITIEDTEVGFDSDDLPKLFHRFFRGKNSGKDSIGIGLALSRAIIDKQGGIIRAENVPKGGARFVIRFYS